MSRRTYTAEEIVSYYSPSGLPNNFSSFGPVGNNRPDFRPLRMNNFSNNTNITNNNKSDNDGQYPPLNRASSEQTANWEPHTNPQKSPLAPFSSSMNINNMPKHQQSISPSDSNIQAYSSSSFQQDFASVLTPTNDQMPLNEQQQLPQQPGSLPPNTQIPPQQAQQQQQQQPPQYPFMYISPTQFYPFMNSAQPFAVYSQYPQPPQFQPPGYGRPPPQPQFSQRFAYVNQPVIPQILQTDQINLGIPQPQPQLQPQPHQQSHSMDVSFNPRPLGSQFPNQTSTLQQPPIMDIDQNQFPQQSSQSSQQIANNNDYDESEDPTMLMKYDFAFPTGTSQSAPEEESFGSVLHPHQQPPQQPQPKQQPADKAFNPSRLPYPGMNDIQQQIPSQPQQSGSNDGLEFSSVLQEQDEFRSVIGAGFNPMEIQQNAAFSSFPPSNDSFSSVVVGEPNEDTFSSIVSPSAQQPPQQASSNSGSNQGSMDSNTFENGFPDPNLNPGQGMQNEFPSIFNNPQSFQSPQLSNQSFNSLFSNSNQSFPSVVSSLPPQQKAQQQLQGSTDGMNPSTFHSIGVESPQFHPQNFDASGYSIFDMQKQQQDEFSSVIKPQAQKSPQPQQVPQIEPAVFTFQPKKAFGISSSVPPKDTFHPQPIIQHPPQPQPQVQPPPQVQQPPISPPILQPPPQIQPPPQQQQQMEDKKPAFEAPTFAPRRIVDPLHLKGNNPIRSKSTPMRTQSEQLMIPTIRPVSPQFQPQPQPTLQIPPQSIFQPQPQPTLQPPPQLQQQPQLHDAVQVQHSILQQQVVVQQPQQQQQPQVPLREFPEIQKEITSTDPSMKKFQPKPFNAIEVEEQKRPESPSNVPNQPPPPQRQKSSQPKQIRKRQLPGPPFDPKPIAHEFYYSPTPAPDIRNAIKPRKDTLIGRRRVW